jgi:DNA polymerase-3 subunit delta
MLEAITRRDRREALDIYADMLARKEPPIKIIVMLARQYNQLLMIREMMDDEVSSSEFASRAGLNPYAVKRMTGTARHYSASALKAALSACVAMLEAVTSGSVADRLAVELLLVRLST